MVCHRKQRVCVGRKVHPYYVGLLVDDVIDEARVLMAESVMILTPYMRCQQIVQRRDGTTPGNIASGLQPLGMLIEHGVDDVDEGLVAGEEAVAAG